ncbi:PBSX family phage terminase large subunit [Alicyclobacillus macrosporangiidus]|uniref:Phage terminase, large subunit, PBSX family n=1 Tax=Alicyclobacillus macrosporangiidus TaxID=392015 RepID=A0A1I7ID72_9BACL|nr:PBSX family phage terminase large subunit [Alicyclobacillus macrosporangiidus]SFU70899.1 phage terminase, large subunit, PBSX family [Alicyclobacillus macrosporangiidus]
MSFTWGRFSQKQLDSIRNSTARLNFWEGAVRSGKTIASIVRWLDYIATGPSGDLLMVGKTERTLKRNILDVMEQILGPRLYRYNKGEGEVYVCGRKIYVAGANDERAEGKIRGMTLAGAYGDEVTLWPENFFKMLLSRLSVSGAKFFGTTNPDSPYHWLKVEYLDKTDLDLRSWHFVLEDNPNLDQAYVEALKREYTGLWYKRFILGLWVMAEGAIYDMWDDTLNTFTDADIPPGLKMVARRYISVDYGTQNATVFLDCLDDGDTLWIVNEYYHSGREQGRQKEDAEYADDLLNFAGPERPRFVIADPSAASFKIALRRRGLMVRDAENDVLEGIRMTATMIAKRKLRVNRDRCPHLVKEIAGYVWDAKAAERGEEKPLKQNDHAVDAMRYLVATVVNKYRLHSA